MHWKREFTGLPPTHDKNDHKIVCHANMRVHDFWGAQEAWLYLEGWKEPKEQVAVVLFVHGQVSSIALDVGSWQLSNQTQFPGWKQQADQVIAAQIQPVCGFRCVGRPTFIYGAPLQVRSEKKGGAGVGCVWRTDPLRFPAEKSRAAPRFCGVQNEAQQLESEGSPTQPAETDRYITTQIQNQFDKGRFRVQAGISSLERIGTHLIINPG